MTETEWLTCDDPSAMIALLETTARASNRTFRLFAVACCRTVWTELRDERSRAAVEAAELYADGHITPDTMRKAFIAGYEAAGNVLADSTSTNPAIGAFLSATRHINETATRTPATEDAAEIASHVWSYATKDKRRNLARWHHVLLRDIFGNPFRPVAFDPAWRTDTAVALARQMYDSRDFGAMPILADALQDAGCEDEQVLMHCRQPGPHARGCWVCDAVLL